MNARVYRMPPTDRLLSTLEQEYWLIASESYDRPSRDAVCWAVARSWEPHLRQYCSQRIRASGHGDLDDLVQAGLLGAYRATQRYRCTGGWVSCVYYGIRKEISCFHYKSGHMIRIPQSMRASIGTPELVYIDSADHDKLAGHVDYIDEDEIIGTLDRHQHGGSLQAAIELLDPADQALLHEVYGHRADPERRLSQLARRRHMDPAVLRADVHRVLQQARHLLVDADHRASVRRTQGLVRQQCYEMWHETYLTWQEIARAYEMDTPSEAHRCADEHAQQHGLQRPPLDDRCRQTTAHISTAADCHRLAEEGYTWAEVASSAFVPDESDARRYARTHRHRARTSTLRERP